MSVNSKVILDHFFKDTEQIENWYWCVSKKKLGMESGSPASFEFSVSVE